MCDISGLCENVKCAATEFSCVLGQTGCCISTDMVCDGYADCMDSTDESNCHTSSEDSLGYTASKCICYVRLLLLLHIFTERFE